ncbi:hypothetical protein [Clostridium perfringens]|uniref:hypothetical protein n=2 Tax=Clostridiaceae TaxID=31979 RepID=UPI0022477D5A|nr:hypothetical protein [Clostridium perfringens]
MWHVVNSIYNIILPVGMSLAVLYFVIDFLNKSVMLEYMRWENVVKSLFRLVVAKIILQNVFKLMTLILGVASNIIMTIGSNAPTISKIDFSVIQQQVDKMGFLDKIMYYISILPMGLIMDIIKWGVMLIVFGRMFEIFIYTALAPIPLAGFTGEATTSTAKNFLQDYAGVCLQGVVIIVACMLYGGLMKDVTFSTNSSGIKDLILYSLVLLLVLVKSGSWAKKLTGGM